MFRIAFGLGLIGVGLWANWHIWSVTYGAAFAWDVTTWPILFHNIWADPLGYAQIIYSLAIFPPIVGLLCLKGGRRRRPLPRLAPVKTRKSSVRQAWQRPTETPVPAPQEEPGPAPEEPAAIEQTELLEAAAEVVDPQQEEPRRRGKRKLSLRGIGRRFGGPLDGQVDGGVRQGAHDGGRGGGRLARLLSPFAREISHDVKEMFGADLEGIRRIRGKARRSAEDETPEPIPKKPSGRFGFARLFRRDRCAEVVAAEEDEAVVDEIDPTVELFEEVLAWYTVWAQSHRHQRTETMRRRAAELLAALSPDLRNRFSEEHGMHGISILHTLAAATEQPAPEEDDGSLAEPVPQPSTEDLLEETNRLYAAGPEAKTGPAFSEDDRPKTPELRDLEAPAEGHDLARNVNDWSARKISVDPDEEDEDDDPIAKFSKVGETPEGMMAGLEMEIGSGDATADEADPSAVEIGVMSFGPDEGEATKDDGSSVFIADAADDRSEGDEAVAGPTKPTPAGEQTFMLWREHAAHSAKSDAKNVDPISTEFGPLANASNDENAPGGEDVAEEAATLNSLMGGIAQRVERVPDSELIEEPTDRQEPASTMYSTDEVNAVISSIPASRLARMTGSNPDARRRTEQNFIRVGLAALSTRDNFIPALWELLQQVVRYQSMVHAAEHLGESFPEEFQDPKARADHLFKLVTGIATMSSAINEADREELIALKSDTEEARWLKNRRAEKLIELFKQRGVIEPGLTAGASAKEQASRAAASDRPVAVEMIGGVGAVDGDGGASGAGSKAPAQGATEPDGKPEEPSGSEKAGREADEGAIGESPSGSASEPAHAPGLEAREDWLDGAIRLAMENRMAVRRELRFNPGGKDGAGASEGDRAIDLVFGRRIAERNLVLAVERVAVMNRIRVPAGKWSLVVRNATAEGVSRCFLEAIDEEGEISLRDGGFRFVQLFYKAHGLAVEPWLLVELDPAAEIYDAGDRVDPEDGLSACLYDLAGANVRVRPWSADDFASKIAAKVI